MKVINLSTHAFFSESKKFKGLVQRIHWVQITDLEEIKNIRMDMENLKTFEKVETRRALERRGEPLIAGLKEWLDNFLEYPALTGWLVEKTKLRNLMAICEFLETPEGLPIQWELLSLTDEDYRSIENKFCKPTRH